MMEHVTACTVAALIALAASVGLRGQRSGLRHGILFLALLRFAVPTAWLTAAGRLLVRVAPVTAAHAASGVPWLAQAGRSLRYPGLDLLEKAPA